MIDVKLLALTNQDPTNVAAHAGVMCYNQEVPVLGETKMDPRKVTWPPGHHTTYQHWSATFQIVGISVSDITLGMHLANPFYNSCQKSGRWCAEMFDNPDYEAIALYISTYWPALPKSRIGPLVDMMKGWIEVYQEFKPAADKVSWELSEESRPRWSDETRATKTPKIAQEQMRMFVPTIFPTAFDYTINLSVLAAMYETAFTPAMRDVTEKMVGALEDQYPDIGIFDGLSQDMPDWAPKMKEEASPYVSDTPFLTISDGMVGVSDAESYRVPSDRELGPLDLLHFRPENMDNGLKAILVQVMISLATMGQDQRHRTIRRGMPTFTGAFYLPPIPARLGLKSEAERVNQEWLGVRGSIPDTLWSRLAPYGSMVEYSKLGDLNAVMHEQHKRLCHQAQEEIYNLSRLQREAIENLFPGSQLLKVFEPPCYGGKCPEGGSCGRDRKADRQSGNYFPRREM